ncbi:MAG: hypothetical protein HKM07_06975 [Chlamydiae bacterium]|nr:hypothetical protein [Chlamydiota bacterium]
MPLTTRLHEFIARYNVLQSPTVGMDAYLKNHPNLYKAVLLANHVFRAASMAAFHKALPYSAPVNTSLCFGGSLFYRLSVETNCAYKFALPAFAGSIALPMGKEALTNLLNGVAFASRNKFVSTLASLIPIAAYITYIALTVSYDVDKKCEKK